MDPLSLLRDFNLQKKVDQVKVEGDNVLFGDLYSYPKNTFTALKGRSNDYYTLQAILFLLQTRDAPVSEYLSSANKAGVSGYVPVYERKKVLEYLDGEVELDLTDVPQAVPAPIVQAVEPPAKRPKTEGVLEDNALKLLLSQERQLRNRNTMLLAPNRTFEKALELSEDIFRHRPTHAPATGNAASNYQHRDASKKPLAAPVQPLPLPVKPSGRFERDAATEQLKAMGGKDLINMIGAGYGYAGQKKGDGGGAAPASGRGAPKPASTATRPTGMAPTRSHPSSIGLPGKGGTPIIIVPSGLSAMITMYNAREFLEKGTFVTNERARQDMTARGEAKAARAQFMRSAARKVPVPYILTDTPPPPRSPDWQSVVAVIAQGVKWQFKDWPYKGASDGELVETFSQVCGFYVHYHDEQVLPLVKSWNVRRIPIHRASRHLDMTAMLDLYKQLDAFLASKKSQLAY